MAEANVLFNNWQVLVAKKIKPHPQNRFFVPLRGSFQIPTIIPVLSEAASVSMNISSNVA